jgi:hypothetical protein
MAKRALFNASSAYVLGNIGMELTVLNFRNVEGLPVGAETSVDEDVYIRNAVPAFLALNAQGYRSRSREHVVGQLANQQNLPPNIPGNIMSFGLENPVDFLERGINPFCMWQVSLIVYLLISKNLCFSEYTKHYVDAASGNGG